MARNGWNDYQKLVLSQLVEHAKSLDDVKVDLQSIRNSDIPDLKVEIAMLKVKAGMWGAIAGALPALAAIFFMWLKK